MNKGILITVVDDVCTIKFNSENANNVLSQQLTSSLISELDKIEVNPEIKIVIITGDKHVFSKGQDVGEIKKAFTDDSQSYKELLKNSYSKIVTKIRNSSKIYIAAVNGFTIGAGISIAFACDLVVASENAIFYAPYVNLGLIPDGGLIYFFLRTIGYYKTFEFLSLGDKFTATEALELGLINFIEHKNSLQEKCVELANILTKKYATVSLIKSYLNENLYSKSLNQALEIEEEYQDRARNTSEHQNAMKKLLLLTK